MSNIKEPNLKNVNLYRLTYGISLTPRKRLESFDDEVYEDFIACWLLGYVKKKYYDIENMGGAGDKGRDVVAYVTDKKEKGEWDNYQCKQYRKSLAPTNIYKEVGKLLYYTYIKDYTIPRKYYFVAPKNVGTKLSDLLKNPNKFKKSVIENWDKHCKTQITKKQEVMLEGKLKEYVDDFSFEIFDAVGTHTILKDFENTKYYTIFFGGGFIKPRPLDRKPGQHIESYENGYISCLLEAYGDYHKKKIIDVVDLKATPNELEHFQRQRINFYKAESLKDYASESLPTDNIYNEFQDNVYDAIIEIVEDDYSDGYECLKETLKEVLRVDLSSNILSQVTNPADRKGICHQLANNGKLRWVRR